jgi:predicted DNA-binding protein (MmcQ/YjbR family)
MDIEQFRTYCLQKEEVTETFPFDEVTLCFKVNGKIFALTGLDAEHFQVNLKCDPDYALELREAHEEVQPGYHMNKKHWNTVSFVGSLSDTLLKHLIDHSYELVKKGAKRR